MALGLERLELSEIPAFLLSPSSALCEGLQGQGSNRAGEQCIPRYPVPSSPKSHPSPFPVPSQSQSLPSPSPSPDVINKALSCGPGYRIALL